MAPARGSSWPPCSPWRSSASERLVSIEHALIRKLRGAPRLVTLVATIAIGPGHRRPRACCCSPATTTRPRRSGISPPVLPRHFSSATSNRHRRRHPGALIVPLDRAGAGRVLPAHPFGVAIRAAAENGDAARLLGISVDRVVDVHVGGRVGARRARRHPDRRQAGQPRRRPPCRPASWCGRWPPPSSAGSPACPAPRRRPHRRRRRGDDRPATFREHASALADVVFFLAVVVIARRSDPRGCSASGRRPRTRSPSCPTVRDLPGATATRPLRPCCAVAVIGYAVLAFTLAGQPGHRARRPTACSSMVVIYAMVGVSLTVLMGYTGQISLGPLALVGVGRSPRPTCSRRIARAVSCCTVPLVVVIGMAVSLVIGLPALRIKGLYLAVVTLAFSLAAELLPVQDDCSARHRPACRSRRRSSGPLDLDDAEQPAAVLLLVAAACSSSMCVARNLPAARTGRGFFALRENEKAAATLGVRLHPLPAARLRACRAASPRSPGVLYAVRVGTVQRRATSRTEHLAGARAMVMIGGLGSLSGPHPRRLLRLRRCPVPAELRQRLDRPDRHRHPADRS